MPSLAHATDHSSRMLKQSVNGALAYYADMISALNGNYGGGIQQGLAGVDVAVDQVSSVQGELGALSNRLGATKVSLNETKAFLSNLLSSNEDVDLVSAISSLTLQQQAIEAAGATLNRIFQSSLLNFLK